jgi:RNA-binding protein
MKLSSRQRAHLRGLAHDQKPAVHIGKDGLTEAVVNAIDEAFNTREVLKVRVLDNAPQFVRGIAAGVVEAFSDVHLVQTIGHVAIFYRPHPDDPQVELPARGEE